MRASRRWRSLWTSPWAGDDGARSCAFPLEGLCREHERELVQADQALDVGSGQPRRLGRASAVPQKTRENARVCVEPGKERFEYPRSLAARVVECSSPWTVFRRRAPP